MPTTAWKFLFKGGRAPISRVPWPQPDGDAPGAWLEADGPLAPCWVGVHACRADDLAHWVSDELWEVELDGELQSGPDCVLARRGRLVRRIDAWQAGGATHFAQAAADHAASQVALARATQTDVSGYIDDARVFSSDEPAASAFCAAVGVAHLEEGTEARAAAFRRERSWQSAWIAAWIRRTCFIGT